MQQGWIKIHRSLLQSSIFQNEKLLKVFMYCLLKASHQELETLVGLQKVQLKQGQFVFGRKKAALELDMKESTIWKYMKLLESVHSITLNSNNKFTVVTVDKWAFYQGSSDDDEQQKNNKRTTKEQQSNTNKNVKNEKNNITRKSTKRFYEDDSNEMILVNHFIKYIQMNDGKFKNPNKQKWADDIRKIIELDGRDKREVARVIVFAQQNDFWKANILSPAKLRDKYSTLIMQMNRVPTIQQHQTPVQAPIYKEYVHDPNRDED